MDFNKLKLVIWDLDDTLWNGTLTEGGVDMPSERKELLKNLTDCGIVNTICSKNNYDETVECLKSLSVDEYFVFKSIDWTPKGQRISTLLKDMGLRAENCLFIDDNEHNLQDALFHENKLSVAMPDIIPQLEEFVASLPKKDTEHKRLKQYRVLEEKQESKRNFGTDNEAFLYSTNTRVEIHKDCLPQLERIHELIMRTNQLNFTKNRSSIEELQALLNDSTVSSAYVTAKDKFGDYGIVGFYAVKDNKLIHFLFSCRTIGQGVEQYVYSMIQWPELEVVGDVVSHGDRIPAPKWINQNGLEATEEKKKCKGKILFKGPCDIYGIVNFLQSDSIISELTYGGVVRQNYIEHHNHSVNFLQFYDMSEEEKQEWLAMGLNDEDMFKTAIYDDDLDIVFLSSVLEPGLGVYRNKQTGKLFAWGGFWDKPLTDKQYWDCYINKEISTGDNKITREFLESFSSKYEFVGRQTPEQYIANLKKLLSLMSPKASLCILLGSEIPYENNKISSLVDRHIVNKQFNDAIKSLASENPRVSVIDFTKFIKGQEDFADRITHFSRRVYYDAACEVNRVIEEKVGNCQMKSKYRYFYERTRKKIYVTLSNIRNMFH